MIKRARSFAIPVFLALPARLKRLRAAYRFPNATDFRSYGGIGFRVARTLP